jgi:hypothetical protein
MDSTTVARFRWSVTREGNSSKYGRIVSAMMETEVIAVLEFSLLSRFFRRLAALNRLPAVAFIDFRSSLNWL